MSAALRVAAREPIHFPCAADLEGPNLHRLPHQERPVVAQKECPPPATDRAPRLIVQRVPRELWIQTTHSRFQDHLFSILMHV